MKVINNNLPLDRIKEKSSSADVLLSIKENIINLEMNKDYYKGLFEKNDLYAHKILSRAVTKGDIYKEYRSLIQININNFDKFKKAISVFKMIEEETHEIESENFIKYHISLPKILQKYYNKEKLSYLEKMLCVIGTVKQNDLEKISMGDDVMMEYESKIKDLSDDERFANLYDVEEERAREAFLKEKYRIEIATEKGLEQGIEQGMKQEKTTIIKNMIKKGMDQTTIIELTGIDEKSLKELMKTMK